ncbi:MAG: hypothetical protein A3K19_12640 [Lentisphaerae bacterium RIFOXYB12_FULL_65_16]|nr:MAG: hypothetical protein A3K18_24410 [Lentisphaerae bacterium RIFOXYA12_64_32]OGV88071.1 MAG: hypothetical protein A3K19_12640 [Lentisphaerae bacterium RIFOXYB12_FULL_65_16]
MGEARGNDKRADVIRHIVSGIRDGRLGAGERLAPERQLATELGTTSLTVGRAMRELALAGLIERRVGSGSFITERGARLLQRTTVNVFSPPGDVEPLREFRELSAALIRECGWEPNPVEVHAATVGVAAACVRLFPWSLAINGQFVAAPPFRRAVTRFSRLSILVGALDSSVFDVVIRADDSVAVRAAVAHLRALGCASIGLIAEPPDNSIHELLIALWRSTQPLSEVFSDARLITIPPNAPVSQCVARRLRSASFPVDGLVCPLKWFAEVRRAYDRRKVRLVPSVALARAGNVPGAADAACLSGVVANDLERHVRTAVELFRRYEETEQLPRPGQRMHLVPPRFQAYPGRAVG